MFSFGLPLQMPFIEKYHLLFNFPLHLTPFSLVIFVLFPGRLLVCLSWLPNLQTHPLKQYPSVAQNKYTNVAFLYILSVIINWIKIFTSLQCIHGDLAARNVFIDNNKVAKVGDFGMARDISDRGIYTKTSNVSSGKS